jgi:hypothetical protein
MRRLVCEILNTGIHTDVLDCVVGVRHEASLGFTKDLTRNAEECRTEQKRSAN